MSVGRGGPGLRVGFCTGTVTVMPKTASRHRDPPSRLAILEAAEAEFAERGFAGVRIEHVAARAGYNKSLVYRYFGGREGLYRAVLERAAARRSGSSRPLPASLADLLTQIGRELHADPRGARLLLGRGTDPAAEDAAAPVGSSYHEQMTGMIRVLQGTGEIEPEFDSGMFYLAMLGLASVPLLLPHVVQRVTGLEADDPRFRERWEDTLVWLTDALTG